MNIRPNPILAGERLLQLSDFKAQRYGLFCFAENDRLNESTTF